MAHSRVIAGFKLYYQGTWDDSLFEKCVAVVGSRRMTEYGRRVVEKIIPGLVQDGFTIVSGFMYGVDQEAHRTAVRTGGRTIAVLGWGIDIPLEAEDQKLATEIVNSGGLVLSEWTDQKGALWTFPRRNRIVAAIAQEIIVVEAALKSGSLITAELGLKLGKKVWAVPGPITSSVSAGTNQLIAEGKAQMYLYHPLNLPPKLGGRNPQERVVLELLQNEPLDASEIARKLGQSIEKIGAELSMLVLSGAIIERGGKYYVGEN